MRRLPARKRFLQPRQSRGLPQSTPHPSPKPRCHPTNAMHQGSENHQSLLARANLTLLSQRLETHLRSGSLLQTRARSERNPRPAPSPSAAASVRSNPSVASRRKLSTFRSNPYRRLSGRLLRRAIASSFAPRVRNQASSYLQRDRALSTSKRQTSLPFPFVARFRRRSR